jgi:uncharacterized protein
MAKELRVDGSAPATPAQAASRIWTDIDLDAEGKQLGYLRLNISTHEHSLSWVPIPFAVFKNGQGPRILLLGGVHGDEYEGQVMLMKLMRTLDIENVRGELIILPVANAPAAYAGRRVSPLDGGNLNRLFPGDPNGTPTQEIAHFIASVLMPRAQYVFDFHSGGGAMEFIPSAHVYYSPDKAQFERLLHFLEVFGMPTSVVLKGLMGNEQRLIGVSEKTGVLRLSTELGGAARISVPALQAAEQGLARLLHDVGALRQPMTAEPAPPIRLMTRLPNRKYVYALASGLFEPYVELGASIEQGQVAGAIHFPQEPWRAPEIVKFGDSGTVYAVRPLARTVLGDLLFIIAVPWRE